MNYNEMTRGDLELLMKEQKDLIRNIERRGRQASVAERQILKQARARFREANRALARRTYQLPLFI